MFTKRETGLSTLALAVASMGVGCAQHRPIDRSTSSPDSPALVSALEEASAKLLPYQVTIDDAYAGNCYGYAVGGIHSSRKHKPQPGQAAWGGSAWENPDYEASGIRGDYGDKITAGAIADGLIMAGKDPIRAVRDLPPDHRLVVLYVGSGADPDYHWVRVDGGSNGGVVASHYLALYGIREWKVQSFSGLMQTNSFTPESRASRIYDFEAFFWIPPKTDVGIDAYLRRTGKLPADVRPSDLNALVDAYSDGRLPQVLAEFGYSVPPECLRD